MDPGKQCVRGRGGYERQIVKEGFFVDCTNLVRILKQCFDFRCECDSSMMNAVIERLDTDSIANKPQAPRLCVPQGNGEHTAKFLQTVDTPFFKGMQDDLGVRVIRVPTA